MKTQKKYSLIFLLLVLILIILIFTNISLGSIYIPIDGIIGSLTGDESIKSSWQHIILNYRVPKAITAVIVGSGLGVAGLLMQTLFRNPLAGPYVLGLSSGASLGVALVILGASFFGVNFASILLSKWSIVIASSIGSFLVLLAVILVSLKVKDTMAILIIGLMFASVTAAIVSVLSYFSTAEQLQRYIFWSFGSLGNLAKEELLILSVITLIGLIIAILSIKTLNTLLLGDRYAQSLGLNIKNARLAIILATSLLAGSITAFAGPIAFIGLAVPHLTKLFFDTSNHKYILPAVLINGAILMLICDSIAQLPNTDYTLPINAVTSLVGAPVVIWLLVRKKKLFV
ncbi:iron chelate uptake ABC transporter family permease subunit [Pseudofulvibacter geojedonensis]|uniref:Iron chelate uptake ABC transporter family permease subunit n=1 Tax=Pseudofulvibacter geojedonensis TaxID=1123758 RepID=A0ABW3HZD9_9FLAO